MGARLRGYRCVVSLAQSIARWPLLKMEASFAVVTIDIYSWRECPSTLVLAVPLRSMVFPRPPTSHFLGRDPPALRCVASLVILCQFQNHLRSLTVCTLYVHLPHLVTPCPYYMYYCCRSCSLSSTSSLSVNLPKRISQCF